MHLSASQCFRALLASASGFALQTEFLDQLLDLVMALVCVLPPDGYDSDISGIAQRGIKKLPLVRRSQEIGDQESRGRSGWLNMRMY